MINLSVCVYLSASISLIPLDQSAQNFVCRFPVAMARSFFGGVALRYVLPVLWMTSCLAAVVHMALRGRPEQLLAVGYVHDQTGV